jgi:hypothetical protein
MNRRRRVEERHMSELQDHLSEWAELWGRVRGAGPAAEGSVFDHPVCGGRLSVGETAGRVLSFGQA